MSYKVSGFNLFNQWHVQSEIIHNFTPIQSFESKENFKVLIVQWCYNVIVHNNKIYISGLYPSSKINLFELNLPVEVTTETNNLVMSGNDRYLLLLDRDSQNVWKCVFKNHAEFKWDPVTKFWNFGTEEKQQNNIESIQISCTMNLCLSTSGLIYDIPLKIDVSQSVGKVCQLQCGNEHAILLTDKGYVYTWGNGRRCQLGHGDLTNCEEPQLVEALAGVRVVTVRAGGWHSCALTDTGDLYVWGWNDSGQLGVKSSSTGSPSCKKSKNSQNDLSSIALPALVDLYEDEMSGSSIECEITDVSCGSKHTVLVLSDNSIWAAGSNKYGQLGAGSDVKQITHYRKVYSVQAKCSLKCGPWATVISTS